MFERQCSPNLPMRRHDQVRSPLLALVQTSAEHPFVNDSPENMWTLSLQHESAEFVSVGNRHSKEDLTILNSCSLGDMVAPYD